MDTQLVVKMLDFVISMSQKPRLSGPEFTAYMAGLTFTEHQFRMYNASLEYGIDELTRDSDTHSRENKDVTINP